jgi:hypothetical protein
MSQAAQKSISTFDKTEAAEFLELVGYDQQSL